VTTDTDAPRIWLDGTTYCAEIDGKVVTSPSREWLAQQLEDAATRARRIADDKAARTAEVEARKAAASGRLPDLEAALADATAARDQAWSTFADAAINGGPLLDSFARWRLAHRRADAARVAHASADHEARHGTEPTHVGGTPPTDLATALDRLVTEREAELRQAEQ
jgi:hypothetical protein